MYVVDVIPFSPGAPGGSLSYRSVLKLPIGSIVTVGLRKKKVPGVVVGVVDAVEAKASLKTALYSLSGTISKAQGSLPDSLMEAVLETATWHAASLGSVLSQLLSEWIENGIESFPDTFGTGFAVDSIESPIAERKAKYSTLITENAAKGRSTLLSISTIAEAEYWKNAFVDLSPILLTGALKDKKREDALSQARSAKTLVIATPHFSFAQIKNLEVIIIDRVGAGGFRLPKRPYIDMRIALLELARGRKLRIVYGDFPLPLEYRMGARKLSVKEGGIEVVDTSVEREAGESWSAVSKLLKERIRAELLQGGRVAVFAVRKRYAPVVVCGDCGQALKDERGKVYAYTQEAGKRLFRTADGTSELSTERNCPNCGSWNLLPLGVGVERVFEELSKEFPDAPIVLFDVDTVRTAVGAKRKLAPLVEIGSIVVGTEAMALWLLAALPVPLSLAAIASADSLLALPFWRARERFVRLGLLLTSIAPRALIATRLPDDAAVKTLRDPKDTSFFDEESSLRKALGYPPYGTLISLSWQGSPKGLDSIERLVKDAISPHIAQSVPDRFIKQNHSKRTLVLHMQKDAWPDTTLSARLASLPPSVRVLVDPESFW